MEGNTFGKNLTRGNVAIGSNHSVRAQTEFTVPDELGEAKVDNVGLKDHLNEDVVRLEVLVDNQGHAVLVKLGKPLC